jgi:hypothetical protein
VLVTFAEFFRISSINQLKYNTMGDLHRQKMEKETIKKWEKDIIPKLVGKRIVSCKYMTEKEMEGLGWYSKALIITLEGGVKLFASADDEGNGAGALFTNIKGLETIPVI